MTGIEANFAHSLYAVAPDCSDSGVQSWFDFKLGGVSFRSMCVLFPEVCFEIVLQLSNFLEIHLLPCGSLQDGIYPFCARTSFIVHVHD